MNKDQKGFTLLELLVVISIIGLLSSIVLSSLSQAKNKAIGARIASDFHQLQIALELSKEKSGLYPYQNTVPATYPPEPPPPPAPSYPAILQILVTDGFIPQLPTEPQSSVKYYYWVAGTSYDPSNYSNPTTHYHCGQKPIDQYVIVAQTNSSLSFLTPLGMSNQINPNIVTPISGWYCIMQP